MKITNFNFLPDDNSPKDESTTYLLWSNKETIFLGGLLAAELVTNLQQSNRAETVVKLGKELNTLKNEHIEQYGSIGDIDPQIIHSISESRILFNEEAQDIWRQSPEQESLTLIKIHDVNLKHQKNNIEATFADFGINMALCIAGVALSVGMKRQFPDMKKDFKELCNGFKNKAPKTELKI